MRVNKDSVAGFILGAAVLFAALFLWRMDVRLNSLETAHNTLVRALMHPRQPPVPQDTEAPQSGIAPK